MAMHLHNIGEQYRDGSFTWVADDAMLYAVAVGAGATDAGLPFTTENSIDVELHTLPLFAVILSARVGGPSLTRAGDFPMSSVLHVGTTVRLSEELPCAGAGYGVRSIQSISDTGKHAVVAMDTALHDADTDAVLATVTTTTLIRGEGGFGGEAPARAPEQPHERPHGTLHYATRPDQALLYRLTGDRNPLHSDPTLAAKVGFDRPILHGLATLGIAAAQLQLHRDQTRPVREVTAEFSSPVVAGDALRTEYWITPDATHFKVWVEDRVVVKNAAISYA
ncbi:MaoC/PaaZ C-terminal domain-containing protein [Microbacterium sp. YY-03]|uniref:MaoC/PaaZ C-terminal domain-containing protein n=1 Tax=Microbacterium sp. YY-03 TaxID=3421636 RepID=UPI003D17B546